MWKQGRVSKDWFADYRGLSARVRVDPETGKASEISWYISGKVEMVSPVRATVDVAKPIAMNRHELRTRVVDAKKIALEVVDRQIAEDAAWANAEYRHNRAIWKKP